MQYYVPNILIRRSRAPSDVFTVTLQTTSAYTYNCKPYLPAGYTLNVDWGDGSSPEAWGSDKNGILQYHYYSTAGTYVVSFWGQAQRLLVAPASVSKDPVKQCNYNWGALQGLSSLQGMFRYCAYLTSPLQSIPAPISTMKQAFQDCTGLPIAEGCTLPVSITDMYYCFANCGAADYDINDFGSSFPLLTNITAAFRSSYLYGDATAFVNKCAANVTYTNAFLDSRCTNIPA
jgi:hypothetical protein